MAKVYRQYYEIAMYPHIAVLDPRTGERLDFWNGFVGPAELTQYCTLSFSVFDDERDLEITFSAPSLG